MANSPGGSPSYEAREDYSTVQDLFKDTLAQTENDNELFQASQHREHGGRKDDARLGTQPPDGDAKKYQCDVCNRRFKTVGALQRHNREEHGPVHNKCQYCDFTAKRRYDIARHVDKVHSEEPGSTSPFFTEPESSIGQSLEKRTLANDDVDEGSAPSQGDAVLIALLGGAKATEVARTAATELLASDIERSEESSEDIFDSSASDVERNMQYMGKHLHIPSDPLDLIAASDRPPQNDSSLVPVDSSIFIEGRAESLRSAKSFGDLISFDEYVGITPSSQPPILSPNGRESGPIVVASSTLLKVPPAESCESDLRSAKSFGDLAAISDSQETISEAKAEGFAAGYTTGCRVAPIDRNTMPLRRVSMYPDDRSQHTSSLRSLDEEVRAELARLERLRLQDELRFLDDLRFLGDLRRQEDLKSRIDLRMREEADTRLREDLRRAEVLTREDFRLRTDLRRAQEVLLQDELPSLRMRDPGYLRRGSLSPLSFKTDLDDQNLSPEYPIPQVRLRRYSNRSDISESSSVTSVADSIFSLLSTSSMSSIMSTNGAGDRLLALLREDSVLKPLYQEALINVAIERLERNLRRLLKRFAVDLRKEAESPQQEGAANFVRCRARNSAHSICGSLSNDKPKPKVVSREAMEEISDNSSDSDSQDDEPTDLQELEAFIVTSRAFEALRSNLRLFIYPDESSELASEETLARTGVEELTSETPAPDSILVLAGTAIEDRKESRCIDGAVGYQSLKLPNMAAMPVDSGGSCPEPESKHLETFLRLSVALMISWMFLYLRPWNLDWSSVTELTIYLFNQAYSIFKQFLKSKSFMARPSIGPPPRCCYKSSTHDHSNLEEKVNYFHSLLGDTGFISACSAVLALLAVPILARRPTKSFLLRKGASIHARYTTAVRASRSIALLLEALRSRIPNCDINLAKTMCKPQVLEDTRRDHSAITTICTLVLFFLPGLFISSIFRTDFFDFSSSNNRHMYLGRLMLAPTVTFAGPCMLFAVHHAWRRRRQVSTISRPRHSNMPGKDFDGPRKHLATISSKVKTLWQNWVMDESLLYLSATARNIFYMEPKTPDGKTRVRWKCACGQNLYDDFTELKQGAAHRLEDRLNQREGDSNRILRSRLSFKSFSSTISTSIDSLKKALDWKEAELPQHELQTNPNERPTNPPAPPTEPLFLLLCHSEGIYTTKLLQLSISDIESDQKLFQALRTNYRQMRSRWWSFLSFRTLTGIKFVKFELWKHALVDIRQKNALPPPDRVIGPAREYRYAPAPPETVPPVGDNLLMHWFQHPTHADEGAEALERFPKRLRDRLPKGLGWGLSLEDGWDCKKTWKVGFGVFVAGSAIFGVLWTVFERSLQDAFAVAAYMVSFAVVSVGFTQAMVGGLG